MIPFNRLLTHRRQVQIKPSTWIIPVQFVFKRELKLSFLVIISSMLIVLVNGSNKTMFVPSAGMKISGE